MGGLLNQRKATLVNSPMTTVKTHPLLPEAEYEDFVTLAEASADKERTLTGVWNA
ncbi:hypothetical protein H0H93_006280, partial [Arthromyces matolae]